MNLMNRMMSYDKTKNINQKCDCEECISTEKVKSENQTVEYPKLSEEEIEQIIFERYSDKDDKTKTFIRKALRIHEDRYDYSNVTYIKMKEYVEIICRIKGHKPFQQTPDAHLRGQGCKKCATVKLVNKRRMTTEEFIEESNKVHGVGRYDYSEVNYVNSNTKVIIICHNHDESYKFKQTPKSHLSGHGCKKCMCEKLSNELSISLEEFVEKANQVHGIGTYDYSKVKYVNMHKEVMIICPKHGEFLQTPSNHLSGKGCRMCGIERLSEIKKLTTKEFIEKANIKHGIGTYNYSEVFYVDSNTPIKIICLKEGHGYFWQTPSAHLSGEGCPKCGGTKKLTIEEFIEKANRVQGIGRYDYSKVNYVNNCTDVIIICPIHGEFLQTPSDHFQGCGCLLCNKKSKGEIKITQFLTNNNIKFEREKRFSDCKNILSLPFDFYIPKYNLCIEFDGKPHFQNINWNGKMTNEEMKENLKSNQLRDQIKNDYCKEKGINLLRIRYDENVEEKLMEYFKKLK